MAIVGGQSGLAVLLKVTRPTVFQWVAKGLPHTREGLTFYFKTDEVYDWLKAQNEKKYAPLLEILEKYSEKEGE
jgi:excisionase family DNA binding protein